MSYDRFKAISYPAKRIKELEEINAVLLAALKQAKLEIAQLIDVPPEQCVGHIFKVINSAITKAANAS